MKISAEVDEFGVLVVAIRGSSWWVEAALRLGSDDTRIDSEAAPAVQVFLAIGIVNGLLEWCTDGGKAEWLNKSWPTTRSIAGSRQSV